MSTSWCIVFTPSTLFVHRFWLKRSDWQDEPDNWKGEDPSGENCALYTKQGDWLDHSCKKLHTFVCETVATSRVCPDGWAHNSGKCYLFSSTRKTWNQSRDHCITLGGHLAIVTSQEEQYFLSQSAIEYLYWMGLSDLETEGQWIWVDSTPLNETGVVFWKKGSDGQDEPDNWEGEDPSGENCAVFTKFKGWQDNSCKRDGTGPLIPHSSSIKFKYMARLTYEASVPHYVTLKHTGDAWEDRILVVQC
ncbi:CD209 antigen-like protein E [Clupea harengus]|uniref:CD209 antigen-like protein E n=1 Tax=Clupea harengus TaxID=7950 RepID=A0A8M1KEC7_CLUHA|nr:CD209 antigen-like protein E [Clupea harengus]